MVQTRKYYLKKPLFDLEVKGHGPRKVIMIHDTPPYGHAPIPNIIDLSQKKQLFDLKVKGQGPKVIMVHDTPLRSMIFGMWVHDHKVVCRIP